MNCSVPAYMGKTLVQSMEASNSNHHTLSLHSRTVPPSSTVLPSIPRGGRPKLPDSQLLSMEKELQCSTVAAYTTHLVSNSGEMGHLYAPCSMISSERHLSSLSTNEEPLGGGSFIPRSSTSNATVSIPLAYPPHSGSFQSQKLNDYPKEFMDAQWSADTIGELLDFTDNVSVDCHQNDGTVASENVSKRNEWDWLSNGSNITPNWNELFPEATVAEHGPKFIDPPPKLLASVSVEQPPIQQQQPPTSSGDLCASASPVTSVNCAPARQRMRWTQEKHKRFVEAVNQIGGCEKATPKAILKLMNYDDLTIYHVKSHLQKYRNARYRPDSSEGTSVKSNAVLDNMSSLDLKSGIGITEALQLQMEVQKRLHEQLEIQRNLQLKIEEQGRYLQMMFEKQCKTNINKIKAPTTTEAQTWEVTSANNTNAASDKDQNEKGSIDIGANTSVDNCRKVGGKQKIMAPRISDDVVNQNPCSRLYSPLAKRAKGSYPGLSSVPSTSF